MCRGRFPLATEVRSARCTSDFGGVLATLSAPQGASHKRFQVPTSQHLFAIPQNPVAGIGRSSLGGGSIVVRRYMVILRSALTDVSGGVSSMARSVAPRRVEVYKTWPPAPATWI